MKITSRLSSLALLCLFLAFSANAQENTDVEFARIKQKKIRNLILKNQLHKSKDFEHMQEVCSGEEDQDTYNRHIKTFLVKESLDKVWNGYCTVSPKQSWCGKMVSFGMMFNPAYARLLYANDPYEGLKVGQVLFIQLKLFKGLYKLAVAHKVTAVDAEKKRIQICYMKNGASAGSQYISFRTTPEGFTEVVHESFYKSKSRFRDTKIYPKIHEKVITEFHENVALEVTHSSEQHPAVSEVSGLNK